MNDNNNFANSVYNIVLCEKKYKISRKFEPLEYYFINLNINDAKKTLSTIIYNNIEGDINKPSIETIYNEEQAKFDEYINYIVANDRKINFYFLKTDNTLTSIKRLEIAVNLYNKPFLTSLKTFINSYDVFLQNHNTMISQFLNMSLNFSEYISNSLKALLSYNEKITELIENLDLRTLTKKQRQNYVVSYDQWGKYGWTVIPDTPIDLYYNKPDNLEEADKIVFNYMTQEKIQEIILEIKEMDIKQVDLQSALFCFNKMQYKACYLMLFSLIDSLLLEIQSESKNVGKKSIVY